MRVSKVGDGNRPVAHSILRPVPAEDIPCQVEEGCYSGPLTVMLKKPSPLSIFIDCLMRYALGWPASQASTHRRDSAIAEWSIRLTGNCERRFRGERTARIVSPSGEAKGRA